MLREGGLGGSCSVQGDVCAERTVTTTSSARSRDRERRRVPGDVGIWHQSRAPKSVTDQPEEFYSEVSDQGILGSVSRKVRRGANLFRRPKTSKQNFLAGIPRRNLLKYGSSRIQGTSVRKGIFENLRRRNADDGYFPTALLRGEFQGSVESQNGSIAWEFQGLAWVRSESQESRRFFVEP